MINRRLFLKLAAGMAALPFIPKSAQAEPMVDPPPPPVTRNRFIYTYVELEDGFRIYCVRRQPEGRLSIKPEVLKREMAKYRSYVLGEVVDPRSYRSCILGEVVE